MLGKEMLGCLNKMLKLFFELKQRFPFASIILNNDVLTVQQIDGRCITCGKKKCKCDEAEQC